MVIRWRHVDMCWLEACTILGQRGWQQTGTVQDPGQMAGSGGNDVLDHKDCRR